MKRFLICLESSTGSQLSGYFESDDMNIAMQKAISHFSKECNVSLDDIFIVFCEEE